MKRFAVCVLACVFAVLVVPAAASASVNLSSLDAATPVAGGVLTFPLQYDPVGIEPLTAQESEGYQVAQELFWGLTRYQLQSDGTLATEPCVASSWDVNTNATVFTFHLRHGVMFAAPVSREVHAQDFISSWNRATNPANGCPEAFIFASIQGADDSGYALHGLTGLQALDDYTLQVTLRYPFAELPVALARTVAAPVPGDYIATLGKTAVARNAAFAQKPVGDGPYLLAGWSHGQLIVLDRNPAFWDATAAGYVDEIQLPIYADIDREWADFQAGNLDFTMIPQGDVPTAVAQYGTSADGYTASPGAQTLLGSGNAMGFVTFNCQKAPFNKVGVRRAFSLALDRQAVINILGTGTIATDFLPSCVPGYQANAWPYSHYDLTAAKAQLSAAGYPNGVGLPAVTYIYTEGDPLIAAMAAQIKTNLQALGVSVKLAAYSWGDLLSRMSLGNFQMGHLGWIGDYPSADNFLYPIFQSSQSAADGAFTFYSNATVDSELATARAEPDAATRLTDYQAADQTIGSDAPVAPLWAYGNSAVGGARLSDGVLAPNGWFDFDRVWLSDGDQAVPAVTTLASSSHPAAVWYHNNTPAFSWTAAAPGGQIDGYSHVLDHNAFAFPQRAVMTTQTDVTLPKTADGLWYFHLRAHDDDGIWGPVATYAVRIDTHRPTTAAAAAVKVRRGAFATLRYRISDAKPNAGWASVVIEVRGRSGQVKLVLGKKAVNKLLSARFRCRLKRGTYRFSVYAVDGAGNKQSKVGYNKLVVT